MRKTFKDYKKEYDDILIKQRGIESRIKDRARRMSNNHPDVIVAYFSTDDVKIPIDAATYYEEIHRKENNYSYLKDQFAANQYLSIIKAIEDHNERQAGIKQLRMFE